MILVVHSAVSGRLLEGYMCVQGRACCFESGVSGPIAAAKVFRETVGFDCV